ncbi:MAG TPA: peptidoglycan DD-metalloendopeptidase family protein [Hyphomicrobiaceae bacterium]|nr:peptidoglycan DD-metalloendopeptidase family protein [Hyphomicrobiaceae bacterium]
MLRSDSGCRPEAGQSWRGLATFVAAASLFAGGCSSGVTRFDYPPFGLTETSAAAPPPRARTDGPPSASQGGSYTPQSGPYGSGYGYGTPPVGAYANSYPPTPPATYGSGYAPPASGPYGGQGYGRPAAPNQDGYGSSYGTGYGAPPPASYRPPQAGGYGSGYGNGAPAATSANREFAVSALPRSEAAPRSIAAPVSVAPPLRSAEAPTVAAATKSTAAHTAVRESAGGAEIEVKDGDTLYTLARRYGVSMSELMRVNGMSDPNLKPGQSLRLPAGAKAVAKATPAAQTDRTFAEQPSAPVVPAVASAAHTAPLPAAERPAKAETAVQAAPVAAPAAPAGWTDTYTIKSGDNLYGLARQRGVTVAELQRINGITDVHKVMPGQVLRVPPEPVQRTARETEAPVASEPSASVTVEPSPTSTVRPTVLNGTRVAALETKTAVDAGQAAAPKRESAGKEEPVAAKAAFDSKLRWPVKGRIIAGFGPQADGTQNDGINVAVPLGTEVLAAESGVVAYAGNEVRGYGNLVLVRHDNGWVTAYAHNDQLLVQRGDRVRRGQVLAKAGKTGNVDQPQLHFELRQGPKPVDPLPHMERL